MGAHRRSIAAQSQAHNVIVSELESFLRESRVRHVHFAEGSVVPPALAYVTNFPRLSLPLKGCHRMEVAHLGRSQTIKPFLLVTLVPGIECTLANTQLS